MKITGSPARQYLLGLILIVMIQSLCDKLPAFAQTSIPIPAKQTQASKQAQPNRKRTPDNLEKESYRIWLAWHRARKQGKTLPMPTLNVPASLGEQEADRILTIWEQAQRRAHHAVEEEGMYRVWLEWYQLQQQGTQDPQPNLDIPSGADARQTKQAQALWQRAQNRARLAVEREARKSAKPTSQPHAQHTNDDIASLSAGKSVNSLPNVHIDDATRQAAVRSIIPLQDVTIPGSSNPQRLSGINQPKGIAGVFSYAANSTQSSHLQANSPDAITANNNRVIAELNAEAMKAKTAVNTATAKQLVERYDSRNKKTSSSPTASGGSQVVRRYTYGSHGPISMSQLINGQWVTHWFIYDGQGNVRALTDKDGNVTDTFDYDSYGNLISRTGTTPNTRLFAGEEYDEDLGMYNLRTRYMNPNTGRFFTMDRYEGDTSVPISLHKYLYANANPVNVIDPSGKFGVAQATGSISVGLIGAALPKLNLGASVSAVGQIKIGSNPFEKIMGDDFTKASLALFGARLISKDSKCDTSLIDFGIPSIHEYTLRAFVNENIFDGRKSTVYYPSEGRTAGDILSRFSPPAVTVQQRISPNKTWPILLGRGFFEAIENPADPVLNTPGTANNRVLILLHEIVHQGSELGDRPFGGSPQLSFAIGSKCFPGRRFPGFYP